MKFAQKPAFNFDAYAFQDHDSIYLTLINRSHAPVTVYLHQRGWYVVWPMECGRPFLEAGHLGPGQRHYPGEWSTVERL